MKIDYKICIVACVFCLILGGLIVQSFFKPETHTVTAGGLKFTEYLRDMLKPKFPYSFFFKGKDGRIDTFVVQKHTPISEIPIQECSGTFNIPFIVNDKPDSTWFGTWYVSYQGIGDSISINIPEKEVTLKTYKKFLTFHKSLAVSMDIHKRMSSEFRLGITFGFSRKLTIYGGLSYNSDNEFSPAVGLLIEF